MSEQTVIHLLRHGEVFNPQNVIYERLEGFSLSERGFKMANRVQEFILQNSTFQNIVAVYSSPLQRAIETVKPTATALDKNLILDDRLLESQHKLAGKNGKTEVLQLLKRFKLRTLFDLIHNPLQPSWGESYVDVSNRTTDFISEKLKKHKGEQILICSHQNPIWIARLTAENKKLWHNPAHRVCALASITSLYFDTISETLQKVVYHTPCRDL